MTEQEANDLARVIHAAMGGQGYDGLSKLRQRKYLDAARAAHAELCPQQPVIVDGSEPPKEWS